MPKILYISHSFVTKVNRKIASGLKDLGYEVTLVTPLAIETGKFLKFAEKIDNSNDIIFLKTFFKNPRLQIYIGLSKVLKKINADYIIYDNDPYCMQILLLTLSKSKQQKLYSISCENMEFGCFDLGFNNFVKCFLKRTITPFLVKNLAGIFTVNRKGKEIFINKGFKTVTQIPIGFDVNNFKINNKTRVKTRHNLGIDGICLGYFGRICHEKGLDILLLALSELKSFDWVILIDEFSEYKDLYISHVKDLILEYKLESRIIFINPAHDDIQDYINAADITVLPSITTNFWTEQYGRVISESLACGKHVIVSDSGHLPDLVADNGEVFVEGNAENLREKLIKLFTQDDILYPNIAASVFAHETLSIKRQSEIFNATLNKV